MSAAVEQDRQPHTYYPPERKAEVLALLDASGGNLYQVSEQTGIQRSTIRYWLENKDRYVSLRQQKQTDLASRFESQVHKILDNIEQTDLSEVPFNHQATAIGILTDKMQLLRGQPTNISQTLDSEQLTVVVQAVITELAPDYEHAVIDTDHNLLCSSDNEPNP